VSDHARHTVAADAVITAPDVLHLVGVFDTPGRDPRGHVISVAYTGYLPAMDAPTAADDAQAAQWRPVHELLATPGALAFDHHQILTAAMHVIDERKRHHAAMAQARRVGFYQARRG
jgi:ADP-ribose pyrophosphatase YjhB (NUDIX family)